MATIPTAPQIFIRPDCIENHTADFYWEPPVSDGGASITNYLLTVSVPSSITLTLPSSFVLPPSIGSYRLSNLDTSVDYTFSLQASNSVGLSPFATFRTIQSGVPPAIYGDYRIQSLTSNTATIEFLKPLGDGQASVRYNVLTAVDTDAGVLAPTSLKFGALENASTLTATNLQSNIQYTFLTQAVNDPGYAPDSQTTRTVNLSSFQTTFSPSSITGLQTWWDLSDPLYFTHSGSNITTISDKSSNAFHLTTVPSGESHYPVPGTPIHGKTTAYFAPFAGINQTTTIDGTTNVFFVGRQGPTNTWNFLFGDDTNYDWHGGNPGFILSAFANAGIYNCSSILYKNFQSSESTSNDIFSNVNVATNGSLFLLNLNDITGQTRFQGLFYDRSFGGSGWVGDLGEMITFSNALSPSEIDSVTKYLRDKWNLYPPTNTKLNLWVDSKNSSLALYQSGAILSTFQDSSFFSNHGEAITSFGSNTYYDSYTGTFLFPGSAAIRFPDKTFPLGDSPYSVFVVFTPNLYTGFQRTIFTADTLTLGQGFTSSNFTMDWGNGTTLTSSNAFPSYSNYILSVVYTPGDHKMWLNGVLEASANHTGRNTVLGSNYMSYIWTYASANDLLIYERAVGDSERMSIEQTLADKYSIAPLHNPFTNRPYSKPTDLSGCVLWLDGSDYSTLSLSPSVTGWADKSGNSRNATSASGPTYNRYSGYLEFPGLATDARLSLPDNTFPSGTSSFTTIMVWHRPNPGVQVYGLSCGTANSNEFFGIYAFGTTLGTSLTQSYTDLFRDYTGETDVNEVVSVAFSNQDRKLIRNNTLSQFDTPTGRNTVSSNTYIGGDVASGNYWNGRIAEICVFDRLLTNRERQNVEYNLRVKWGLVPSKVLPNAFSNCCLWLDGKDTNTFGMTGNKLTTWFDKSGQGNHASNSSTYAPTLSSFYVNLDGSQYLRLPDGTLPTGDSDYSAFIVLDFPAPVSATVLSQGNATGNEQLSFSGDYAQLTRDGSNAVLYNDWNGNSLSNSGAVNGPLLQYASYTSSYRYSVLNNSNNTTDAPTGRNTGSLNAALGAVWNGTSFTSNYTGKIFEVIAFDSLLSVGERNQVMSYLVNKWRI